VPTKPAASNATSAITDLVETRNRLLKMGVGAAKFDVIAEYGRAGEFEPVAVAASNSVVYVADQAQGRVLAFTVGRPEPTVLPFTGLQTPAWLGVDADGSVYVFDSSTRRVLALSNPTGRPAPAR
jgi:hypothetical protein